jgi:hypothetical protein
VFKGLLPVVLAVFELEIEGPADDLVVCALLAGLQQNHCLQLTVEFLAPVHVQVVDPEAVVAPVLRNVVVAP